MTQKVKGWNQTPDRAKIYGGKFNMDYGFVCGSKTTKNEHEPLITSKEEYNYYLLIAENLVNTYLSFCLQINYLPLIHLHPSLIRMV